MERPLAADTPLAVERQQIAIWRRMSPADKLALLDDLHAGAVELIEAGIRRRHPQAGPEEVRLRRLCVTLGPELVARWYGFRAED